MLFSYTIFCVLQLSESVEEQLLLFLVACCCMPITSLVFWTVLFTWTLLLAPYWYNGIMFRRWRIVVPIASSLMFETTFCFKDNYEDTQATLLEHRMMKEKNAKLSFNLNLRSLDVCHSILTAKQFFSHFVKIFRSTFQFLRPKRLKWLPRKIHILFYIKCNRRNFQI